MAVPNELLDQEARLGAYRPAKNLDALHLGTSLRMPKPCDFDQHRKLLSVLHLGFLDYQCIQHHERSCHGLNNETCSPGNSRRIIEHDLRAVGI
jgi:hypothetical protein